MVSKELRKLNRRELVDVIYQLKKNEEQMQEKIDALEAELEERRIHLSEVGSIAEATTSITGIFSVAQSTADLYLHEISSMKEDAQREYEKLIEEAEKKVEAIMIDVKKRYDTLASRYKNDYKKWQQLQDEIRKLEFQKEQKLSEE
ncbi:MAG: hypothetical protein IKT62_01395 [Firmicutes bacterium]|nr:hypothetical protein [Bacillota bacterium]